MADNDLHQMSDKTAKPHPLRRIWGNVKKGAGWLAGGLKPPVHEVRCSVAPRGIGSLFKGVARFLRNMVSGWTSDRRPEREDAPDIADFGQVLNSWGIADTEEEISLSIKRLKSRCICVCVMCLLFIASMLWGWEGRVSQVMVIVSSTALLGIALSTHVWRIGVLKHRRFVFFSHWLKGRR